MDLLTACSAAQILGLTPDAVRYHARRGHLLTIKVNRGSLEPMRLFVREDVQRFKDSRNVARVAAGGERDESAD
jgi:hypothetical protein